MRGRMEHQVKNENRMETRLAAYPEYMTDYYTNLLVNNLSHQSMETYVTYVISYLNYLQDKGIDISEPTTFNTRETNLYLVNKSKVQKNGEVKKSSGAYKATIHSALKSFFDFCKVNDMITKDIMYGVKKPNGRKDVTPSDYLTMQEINTILEAIENGVGNARAIGKQKKWRNRDKSIFLLMVTTGIRITALTEIDLESFNEDFTVLTYVDKGEKAIQAMIPEIVRGVLMQWKSDREELLGENTTEAFFTSNQKTRLTQKGVRHIVEKYKEVLGEDRHITPHRLRASFAINLYENTKDIKLVCECMNHSDIKTTNHYIKAATSNRETAMNVFENALAI